MDKDFLKNFSVRDPWPLVTNPSSLLKLTALVNFLGLLGVFISCLVFAFSLPLVLYYIQGAGLGLLYLLSLRLMPKKLPLAFLFSLVRMFGFAWLICELGQKQPWPLLLVFCGCFSYKGVIFLYAILMSILQAADQEKPLASEPKPAQEISQEA